MHGPHLPRSFLSCFLAGLLAAAPLAAAKAAREQSDQSGQSDKIDFSKETLENGLRVIYAPLHQAPVVHVRVVYHVGSKDERPDRQGFAHMFEHMMFRGSAHVPDPEYNHLIRAAGGQYSGQTEQDITTY